jgi:hypothetical protein
VFIGIVTRSNSNNGEIFVKVQNGFELNEIHDVDLKTTVPVNGHILGFNGTLWVNRTIAGWLGYTPANAINEHVPVTIGTANGLSLSTQALSLGLASTSTTGALSSTDWNTFNNKQNALTNPVTGTGTSTRVAFWNNASSISSNANLFWDNTNSRLGIGTASPAESLHVTGSGRFQGSLFAGHGVGATDVGFEIGAARTGNGNSFIDLIGDTTHTDYALRLIRFNTGANAISGLYHRGTGDFVIGPVDSAALRFQTNSSTRLSILSNGNVGIGVTNPSSLLSVNGAISAGTVNATNSTIRGYFVDNNGVPTSNLGNPTVTEMALFDEQFDNKTAFYPIANLKFYTSTDNVNWTEYTAPTDQQKRRFLGGDSVSGITIPNLTPYFRVEITNAGTYVFLNALYLYWSSQSHTTTVKIRARRRSDLAFVQWTNSSSGVSSWPGHLYLPFASIPFLTGGTSSGHYDIVQVDFQPTWAGGAYSTAPIILDKLQLWGGYPANKRNIYFTDENRNVSFPGTLSSTSLTSTVPTGTAPFSIASTTRVGNLNVATAGTADTWTTARTITIGGTGKSVNGSANVSWTLAEIGAQAALTNPVTGTGTTNYITKWSSTNAVTNSQVFDNGTNVGVGNASPQSKLHVSGESRIDGNIVTGYGSNSEYSLTMGQARTGNGFSYIDLIGDTTYTDYGFRMIRFNAGANAESQILHRGTGLLSIGTVDTAPFAIKTIDSTRLYVTASGDVGIGTTSPSKKLDVNGGGRFSGFLEVQNTAEPYNQFKLRDAFTPSSSGDTSGAQGNFAWDDNFIYLKTSSGWKRATIDAF